MGKRNTYAFGFKQVTISGDGQVIEQLKVNAKKLNIPLGRMIIHILRDYCENQKKFCDIMAKEHQKQVMYWKDLGEIAEEKTK